MMSDKGVSPVRRGIDLAIRFAALALLVGWLPYLLYLGDEARLIAAHAHYGWNAVEAMQRAGTVGLIAIAVAWLYFVSPAGLRGLIGGAAALAAVTVVLLGPGDESDPVQAAKGPVEWPWQAGLRTPGETGSARVHANEAGFIDTSAAPSTRRLPHYKASPGGGAREAIYAEAQAWPPLDNERVHLPTMQRALRIVLPRTPERAFCKDYNDLLTRADDQLLLRTELDEPLLEARLERLRDEVHPLSYRVGE